MLPVYPPYIHNIIPTVIYKMAHICEISISLTCRKRSCSIHPFLFSLVQFSCSVVSDFLRSHGLQLAQASLSITNSQSLLNSCHPTISYSVVPFSSCPQSFPASGSFQISQFFTSGGQSIGSFSFSISPSNEYSGLVSFRIWRRE